MPRIAQLGFWSLIVITFLICRNEWKQAMEGNVTTYSAPHVIPEYADTNQDGFVPAQGDPLYDAHYAEEVNKPNSEALQGLAQIPVAISEANLLQAQAEQTEAETERIRQNTKMSLWGTRVILAIVVTVVLLVTFAMFGGKAQQ